MPVRSTGYSTTFFCFSIYRTTFSPEFSQLASQIPDMNEIQSRLSYISCNYLHEKVRHSDYCCYLRPPIAHYKTLDFHKWVERARTTEFDRSQVWLSDCFFNWKSSMFFTWSGWFTRAAFLSVFRSKFFIWLIYTKASFLCEFKFYFNLKSRVHCFSKAPPNQRPASLFPQKMGFCFLL